MRLPNGVPWLSKLVELARSNILAWYVGILVVLLYGYTEQRLKICKFDSPRCTICFTASRATALKNNMNY